MNYSDERPLLITAMPVPVETELRLEADRNGGYTSGSKDGTLLKSEQAHSGHDTLYDSNSDHIYDIKQLRTPSPTPTPRSASPPLATGDTQAGSVGAESSIINRNGHSGSFQQALYPPNGTLNSDGDLGSPLPISKTLLPLELHDIPEEKSRKERKLSVSKVNGEDKILRLTAAELEKLTSSPESLPVTTPKRTSASDQPFLAPSPAIERHLASIDIRKKDDHIHRPGAPEGLRVDPNVDRRSSADLTPGLAISKRPGFSSRAISTPPVISGRMSSYVKNTPIQTSPKRNPSSATSRPDPLDLNSVRSPMSGAAKSSGIDPPSPIPQSIPIPPMSLPTYLQLELSTSKPSPLYIYRSPASEYPYESSKIKFERLLNFLLLPPQLEQVLLFGSLACLDAWLYTFTILPLRFLKASSVLVQWWGHVLSTEVRFIGGFIYHGIGRMRSRQRERNAGIDSANRSRSVSRARRPTPSTAPSYQSQSNRGAEVTNGSMDAEKLRVTLERRSRQGWGRKHRRTKSQPSSLSSSHKADLLQGAVIIFSCLLLMKLDASRMYHSIRGQAAIKLYVIYNALEV